MPCPHRAPAILVLLAGVLATAPLRAAPPDALERARQLFVQAEIDEDKERWSEALDKLRDVSQVRLTAGVRYHVALCEEHLGQLARALADYRATEDQARIENAKDVLRIVGRQLAPLEARVPRLTFHIVPAMPETSVTLDGQPVADPLSGAALPVDPGEHRIEALAPDRRGWTQVVTLQERESRQLDINLAETPSPSPPPSTTSLSSVETPAEPPPPAPPSPPARHADRSLAIVATGVAIAFAAGGVAAYLVADNEHGHAVTNCAHSFEPSACDPWKNRVRVWDFAAAGSWASALVTGAAALALWTKADNPAGRTGARWIVGPAAVGVEGWC
jgi:hypothetical protein